jgi:Skp family chaperone for outer membrane proteins
LGPALSTAISVAALLLLTTHAGAASDAASSPGVHDNAGIFSADAVHKANEAIGQIRDRHRRDLSVEAFAQLPEDRRAAFDREGKARFFTGWASDRAKSLGVNGVEVLICMRPGHVEVVDAGEGSEKVFTPKDRDELSTALGKVLGEKQYDDALARTVAFVEKRMDANEPARTIEAPKPAAPAEHAAQGGMAVIDMDKVAQMIGWQETMTTQSKSVERDLLGELNAYESGLVQALTEREQALADEAHLSSEQRAQLQKGDLEHVLLSPPERDELLKSSNEINQARMAAQNHTRELFQRYQSALLESYRQEIKPAIRRVAFEEGFTLVTMPQANLVYVDPSIDITEKVAKVLMKDMPQPRLPEKPALELRPFKLPPLAAPTAPTSRPSTGANEK